MGKSHASQYANFGSLQKDIKIEGRFIGFDEIDKSSLQLNPHIKKELEHLKDAASLWKDFYL